MGRIYGIDLGTTYSCIACIDEQGNAVVIPNDEGELTTSSVVFFENKYVEVVGQAAKEVVSIYPDRCVSMVKRAMGDPYWEKDIFGCRYKPQDISALILRKIVRDAEKNTGEKIEDVVITYPTYFSVAAKTATEQAGILAGLNVVHLLPEPVAAVLAYGLEHDQVILVYDLGGATFDLTLIEIKNGEMAIISTAGSRQLGGSYWDDAISEFFANKFQEATGIAAGQLLEDRESYQELLNASERCKKNLTSRSSVSEAIRFNGERVKVDLTRDILNYISSEYLNRTVLLTQQELEKARADGYRQIDRLLLVGGSTYMQQVCSAVQKIFPAEILQYEPNQIVAKGAAIFAARLRSSSAHTLGGNLPTPSGLRMVNDSSDASSKVRTGKKIVNVTSKSFGIVHPNHPDRVRNLIFINERLPASNRLEFENLIEDRLSIELQCMENKQRDMEVDVQVCAAVGEAVFGFSQPLPRGSRIAIEFQLGPDGLLTLKGVDLNTGREIAAQFKTEALMTVEYFETTSHHAPPAEAFLRKQRNQIFISYSHKDKAWLERLKTMLKPALRNHPISVWDDQRIQAGQDWKKEIDQAMAAARIAILLVSRDFLDSEFIHNDELPPLLRAAEQEGVKILWLCLSPCLYEDTEIHRFQAAHDPRKPLAEYRRRVDQDKVLAEVCRKIRESIGSPDPRR